MKCRRVAAARTKTKHQTTRLLVDRVRARNLVKVYIYYAPPDAIPPVRPGQLNNERHRNVPRAVVINMKCWLIVFSDKGGQPYPRENFAFPSRVGGVGLVVKSTFFYYECLSFLLIHYFFRRRIILFDVIKLTVVARKRLICLGTFQKVAAFETDKTLQVGLREMGILPPPPPSRRRVIHVKIFILRPNKDFLFFWDFWNVKAKMGDLHLTYCYYYMFIYF